MVMPRSFSKSLESITRSSTAWFSRKVPDCLRSWSTSVVLPWSTCAMMAMLRSLRDMMGGPDCGKPGIVAWLTGYLLCKRVRSQAGVDAVDDLPIARSVHRAEAAVEFGFGHEFRQIAKVRQQVPVAAGGGQATLHACSGFTGGALPQPDAGTVGGQVGEAEARALVGVFFLLDRSEERRVGK